MTKFTENKILQAVVPILMAFAGLEADTNNSGNHLHLDYGQGLTQVNGLLNNTIPLLGTLCDQCLTI